MHERAKPFAARGDRFTNSANIQVIRPPGVFGYEFPRGPEYSATYSVSQDDSLRQPESSQIIIPAHAYSYLHAFNLAGSLAAIESMDFPGMKANGIAYPFEYSVHDESQRLNRDVVSIIKEVSKKPDVHFLEIGGQEGSWGRELQSMAALNSLQFRPTVIDLDLTRRWSDRYHRGFGNKHPGTTYIQADAHHLTELYKSGYFKRPDVIAMINVEDVIYDPFEVFRQAWDLLPVSGILLTGTSHSSVDLPMTTFVSGYYQESLEYGYRRKLSKDTHQWLAANKKLLRLIPQTPFIYKSGETQNSPDIENISTELYAHPSSTPYRSEIDTTLTRMGYRVLSAYGGRHGKIHALVKQRGDTNPFTKFTVAGISRGYFHVDEYVFPQIHRFVYLL